MMDHKLSRRRFLGTAALAGTALAGALNRALAADAPTSAATSTDAIPIIVMGKGQQAAEKYFWRNSVKCYKWVKRTARQPQLA